MATILIVEDEPLIAAAIEDAVQRMGHTALEPVDNSDDALAALLREPVDLVLMDINIQGDTDGIGTALLVLRQFATPVVFLTAQSDAATLNRAKMARPFGYLLKPFTEDILRTQLEMALYAASQPGARALPTLEIAPTAEVNPPGSLTGANFFFVKRGADYIKLLFSDILYAESLENYVRLFTRQGQFIVYASMSKVEARLPNPPFFRPHRSYIANLERADGYAEGCLVFGKDVVPVSRLANVELRRRLNII